MKKGYLAGVMTGAVVFGAAGAWAGQYMAVSNPFPVLLNGESISLEGYNINDSTYFKLRDIADAVGGFDVDFKNNTIQLSKEGYVYPDAPAELVSGMTDHQIYMLNIFLSNFSELDINSFDVHSATREQLIYFGCLHNSRNHTEAATGISDEEALRYLEPDDYINAYYKVSGQAVSDTVDRYIGLSVEHGTASYNEEWFTRDFVYDGGYYYFDSGEEGDASTTFSIADTMYDNGDGTYTVGFTNYYSGYQEVLDVCYQLTNKTVGDYSDKLHRSGSGTAVVTPYNYNGNDTYRLISIEY